MKGDSLGDRMKEYEGKESDRRLIPLIPVIARLDGKAFHTFTKDMKRPYDERFIALMKDTAGWIAQKTNACCAYVQSDEISLAWYSDDYNSQIFFDGRIMKMTSVLASLVSVHFNQLGLSYFDRYGNDSMWLFDVLSPVFDCRVWNVPTLSEGVNTFLWREQDAIRNSVEMAAQHYYSHNELMNKNNAKLQEMLFQKGVNWNDYPSDFKRGAYIQRRKVSRKYAVDELEKLPERHQARTNPDLEVERTEFRRLDMPPLGKIDNKIDVIFRGEDPIVNKND